MIRARYAAVLLALALGGPAPRPSPQSPPSLRASAAVAPLSWSLRATDARSDFLLALHNDARRRAGLPPLAADDRLSAAALWQARDCARRHVLGHIGSDGSWPWDRATRAGYRWSYCGENAAAGQRDALEAVDDWLGSPGHRANVLGRQYTQVGAAFADAADGTRYWTVTFGRPG